MNSCWWCGSPCVGVFGCETPNEPRDCYKAGEVAQYCNSRGLVRNVVPYPPPPWWVPPFRVTVATAATAQGAASIGPLFPPITLREAHAKPKHPKLPCCGYCGDALVKIYSLITGVKLGCDTHGLDVPTVGDFAGLKRHP
jgi:hypothetical protein